MVLLRTCEACGEILRQDCGRGLAFIEHLPSNPCCTDWYVMNNRIQRVNHTRTLAVIDTLHVRREMTRKTKAYSVVGIVPDGGLVEFAITDKFSDAELIISATWSQWGRERSGVVRWGA